VHADEKLTSFLELEAAARLHFGELNTVYWQKITMSKLRRTTER
jgi:hypothetical protein